MLKPAPLSSLGTVPLWLLVGCILVMHQALSSETACTHVPACTLIPDPIHGTTYICSHDNLELLSTIQEIRGPLRIQAWDGESFPYLRNLRVVGDNATTITVGCGGVDSKFLECVRLSAQH